MGETNQGFVQEWSHGEPDPDPVEELEAVKTIQQTVNIA